MQINFKILSNHSQMIHKASVFLKILFFYSVYSTKKK
jgi:hypothetical protein